MMRFPLPSKAKNLLAVKNGKVVVAEIDTCPEEELADFVICRMVALAIWKFTRSPFQEDETFIPSIVPEAFSFPIDWFPAKLFLSNVPAPCKTTFSLLLLLTKTIF